MNKRDEAHKHLDSIARVIADHVPALRTIQAASNSVGVVREYIDELEKKSASCLGLF